MSAPKRTRLRQQPDETRTLILDTAEALLRERPFRELSVDDVMRPTGYRRTVFYRHFAGLPQLVLEVLARVLPELVAAQQAFAEIAEQELSRERAEQLIRPVVEHWSRHGPLLRAMRDASIVDPDVEALLEGTQRRFQLLLGETIARRQAAGLAPGADPVELAGALLGMNQRYLMTSFGSGEPSVTVETAAEVLVSVWVAVMSPRA